MFGGEKGKEGFDIENRTYDCLDCIKEFYSDLSAQLNTIGKLKVATHDELGNSNKNHLSWAIRKEFNVNVITLSMSLDIIHTDSDKVYFQTMKAVIDAIEKNLLDVPIVSHVN
jgi:F0F1-type ATP synthase delta subunit